jgi:hypothetical protein
MDHSARSIFRSAVPVPRRPHAHAATWPSLSSHAGLVCTSTRRWPTGFLPRPSGAPKEMSSWIEAGTIPAVNIRLHAPSLLTRLRQPISVKSWLRFLASGREGAITLLSLRTTTAPVMPLQACRHRTPNGAPRPLCHLRLRPGALATAVQSSLLYTSSTQPLSGAVLNIGGPVLVVTDHFLELFICIPQLSLSLTSRLKLCHHFSRLTTPLTAHDMTYSSRQHDQLPRHQPYGGPHHLASSVAKICWSTTTDPLRPYFAGFYPVHSLACLPLLSPSYNAQSSPSPLSPVSPSPFMEHTVPENQKKPENARNRQKSYQCLTSSTSRCPPFVLAT